MSLKNRSFLKLLDYTPAEIEQLLDLAADLKAKKKAGIAHDRLHGKNIALIFEKTSTRTRCSFEVAAHDLGMQVTYLDPSGSQIGKKESIADTARVLGRMFDGIEYRGYGQQIVEDLAHYAGVPVWNGLTNEFHPTQILADFLTIREHFGKLKGIHFVYFGDARYNMGNSLMVGCAKMGLHFTACAPKKYQPDPELVAECEKIAAGTGATISFEEDPAKAAKGADVLYTDVWVSMGEPVEVWAERIHDLGMEVTYLDPSGSQIGKKESIADTARVLGRMFDGIEYRGYGQSIVEDLAHYAGVPVWNGLTNEFHPTQILADFLTIREHFGHLKGINFVYFGDARYNMGNSLMVGCAKMGLNFTACAPKKYQPDAALVEQCKAIAAETGATISFEEDPAKAAKGADVLYTDVWVSMGEPVEVWAERINDLAAYQINQQLMDIAGPKAVFMHCLPAYHDHKTTVGREMGERFGRDAMEVTDEVFEGPQSIVFDEAENRMHTIKAVMAATLGYNG